MNSIRMLLFDIDGVFTDGRRYMDGKGLELKSLSFKDLDALQMLKDAGYKLGCVTGEDTPFSDFFRGVQVLDYVCTGCKQKLEALQDIGEKYRIQLSEICYIGDGKYDIPILERVGLALCPSDAIDEVKQVSDVVLKRKGGEGCVAEAYTLLQSLKKRQALDRPEANALIIDRLTEHQAVLRAVLDNKAYLGQIEAVSGLIVDTYIKRGRLFLCGNGGSAADAQHLAAELVGRFYLERRALNAEALTVNSSILTALVNDYDADAIFARQLEAKASAGDVLIGITTSGTSENVLQVFQKAQEMCVKTILMTGDISRGLPIMGYTDYLLAVPSHNTPRIQEIHILTGHIICEMIERKLADMEVI